MVVSLTDYSAALDYLFARTTGAWRFGLDRTLELLAMLGDPHVAVPVLHIAGTNGKGSSVATAAALLRAKGLRVGRYTSPHLCDFRERIVANGEPIPAESVTAFIERHLPDIERIGASFFEATTAMAFAHFASSGLDVALIETGLGGRLDSTNVVQPEAAGVTSIGIDHVEYLGDSLQSIAREKAGIFKAGRPAVIGEPDPEVADWLAESARSRGAVPIIASDIVSVGPATIHRAGTAFSLSARGTTAEVVTPLVGVHQAANFAFTVALLDAAGDRFRVTPAEAALAAPQIHLAGRFQRVGRWIFDVAHNPDGARTLAESLAATQGGEPLTTVLCVLGDKDWRAMLDLLGTVTTRFILTDALTAPGNRRWPLDEVLSLARARGFEAHAIADFESALRRAGEWGDTTLVTGSFHTVGDAMNVLQVSPLNG